MDSNVNLHTLAERIAQSMDQLILGKPHQIRLAITCLLAEGHLLIEDVPGVGKTTLAQGLAKVLGLSFQRIQFTSDLLPADITGVSIYDRDNKEFIFSRGRYSLSYCLPMKSIAPHPKPKVRCSKPWKKNK